MCWAGASSTLSPCAVESCSVADMSDGGDGEGGGRSANKDIACRVSEEGALPTLRVCRGRGHHKARGAWRFRFIKPSGRRHCGGLRSNHGG
eukprot:5441152-Prorocentrum_lima.AAC.1